MIVLTRMPSEGFVEPSRIALPVTEILQVHQGKAGVAIVTTPMGKIAVAEQFDEVVRMIDGARHDHA